MLIGITQRIDILDHKIRSYTNYTYIEWLEKQGHSIFLICEQTPISLVLEHCDMLLITGGYDIHPSFYGQKEDQNYVHYNKDLDLFDFRILQVFIEAHKPVLGICRGMQIINVYFNGTLFQDIDHHMHTKHRIYFHKEALLYPYYSSLSEVNSYHHQAIDQLGKFLQIEAMSEDGIVEAISYDRFVIGLQWHPELMKNDSILLYFLSYLKNISKSHK